MVKSKPKSIVVGVAGGTGAGKSTIVKEILKKLGTEKVSVIQHDSYYKNRPELSFEERTKINFDHPDSLDTKLLVEHIKLLISGKNVGIPVFHHFTKYLRDSNTKNVEPRPILIVEGILVLNDKKLRELMNLKIFKVLGPIKQIFFMGMDLNNIILMKDRVIRFCCFTGSQCGATYIVILFLFSPRPIGSLCLIIWVLVNQPRRRIRSIVYELIQPT